MKKMMIGKIISNKMKKTVVVIVNRVLKHCKYGKILRRTTKLYVHDPNHISKIGDLVKIVESRPLSKKKRWILLEVITH
ncbi:30S ribosomal protein S17 [Candidatus Legionella polyplacis]|uniref:Small ribosomal subunit protein uS17 n=1 Tax=Candidatus Legionella polyplacis TaxID=2005262 RepID=A0ABZ2GX18_9GAMM|nr:30S ribosomal protein S17 [Candidatus Legionella polyplacis]ATW01758.1 30S ribosomal protein S17 [Candidatus Legionella polyplacis]